MSSIKFTATKLTNSGKKGVLTPDADGYYELVIGGLNVYNSMGQYYVAEGATDLFKESSIFMRRVQSGCLKGELGHPKKLPGMSMDDYINRLLSIEETNVVCHFSEVWLDPEYGKKNPQFKNPNLVAILAKVKPAGPKGPCLLESLNNPKEDVCFSIRAMTRDYYEKGQTFRVLQQIVCYDNVIEPGLSLARKWDSPGLETISNCNVTQKSLERIISPTKELIVTEDSKTMAKACLESYKDTGLKITNIPLITKW